MRGAARASRKAPVQSRVSSLWHKPVQRTSSNNSADAQPAPLKGSAASSATVSCTGSSGPAVVEKPAECADSGRNLARELWLMTNEGDAPPPVALAAGPSEPAPSESADRELEAGSSAAAASPPATAPQTSGENATSNGAPTDPAEDVPSDNDCREAPQHSPKASPPRVSGAAGSSPPSSTRRREKSSPAHSPVARAGSLPPGARERRAAAEYLAHSAQVSAILAEWVAGRADLFCAALRDMQHSAPRTAVGSAALLLMGQQQRGVSMSLTPPPSSHGGADRDVAQSLADAASVLSILRAGSAAEQGAQMGSRAAETRKTVAATARALALADDEKARLQAANTDLRADAARLQLQLKVKEDTARIAAQRARALEKANADLQRALVAAQASQKDAEEKMAAMTTSVRAEAMAAAEGRLLLEQWQRSHTAAAAERDDAKRVAAELLAKVEARATALRDAQAQTEQTGDVLRQEAIRRIVADEAHGREEAIAWMEERARFNIECLFSDRMKRGGSLSRAQLSYRELVQSHESELAAVRSAAGAANVQLVEREKVIGRLRSDVDCLQEELRMVQEERQQQRGGGGAVRGDVKDAHTQAAVGSNSVMKHMATQVAVVGESLAGASLHDARRGEELLPPRATPKIPRGPDAATTRTPPKHGAEEADVVQVASVGTQVNSPAPAAVVGTGVAASGATTRSHGQPQLALVERWAGLPPQQVLEEKDHLILTLQADQDKLLAVIRLLKLQRDAKRPSIDKWTQLEGPFSPRLHRRTPVLVHRAVSPLRHAPPLLPSGRSPTPPPKTPEPRAEDHLDLVQRNLLVLERALEAADSVVALRNGAAEELKEAHRRFLSSTSGASSDNSGGFVMH